MTIAEKITKLLDQEGWGSRTRLADYLGVPRNYIVRWISDEYEYGVPRDHVLNIARYFGVTADYLLNEEAEDIKTGVVPIIGRSCDRVTSTPWASGESVCVPRSIYTKTAYGVYVSDESMRPRMCQGDIVVCDTFSNLKNGDYVHYTVNGESGLRVFEEDGRFLKLLPFGCTAQPLCFRDDEIVEAVFAKCVYMVSSLDACDGIKEPGSPGRTAKDTGRLPGLWV